MADPVALHADTRGDGTRPALVLLHTIGTDRTLWDDLLAHLPTDAHVLRLDLRGHGNSPAAPGPGRIGAFIADVEHALDARGLRDTVLLGHGLGGLIAQGLATKRLDLVRALVLSGTAARMGTRDRWMRLAAAPQDLPATLAGQWHAPGAAPDAIAARLARQSPQALTQAAEAMAGTDFYTTTAALRLPTLALVGDRDRATPTDLVAETAGLIPGSRMARLRGAGHLAMIDAPADYAAALTGFLTGIGHP